MDNFGPTGGISEGVRKWLVHMGIRDQTVLAALAAVLAGSVGVCKRNGIVMPCEMP